MHDQKVKTQTRLFLKDPSQGCKIPLACSHLRRVRVKVLTICVELSNLQHLGEKLGLEGRVTYLGIYTPASDLGLHYYNSSFYTLH